MTSLTIDNESRVLITNPIVAYKQIWRNLKKGRSDPICAEQPNQSSYWTMWTSSYHFCLLIYSLRPIANLVIIDSGVVYVGEQSDLCDTDMSRAVCSMHVRRSYLHNLLIGQCFDDWKHSYLWSMLKVMKWRLPLSLDRLVSPVPVHCWWHRGNIAIGGGRHTNRIWGKEHTRLVPSSARCWSYSFGSIPCATALVRTFDTYRVWGHSDRRIASTRGSKISRLEWYETASGNG